MKRPLTLWFRHLKTDWATLRRQELSQRPFVLSVLDHGRRVVTAVNPLAQKQGIRVGMALTDARALVRDIEMADDEPGMDEKVLKRLAEWCIRFTPVVAVDMPDGLILDTSGCTHLWGGEEQYLKDILSRFTAFGFHVRGAIADTIGAAWAIAHFTKAQLIVPPGEQMNALMPLPPAALRLDTYTCEQLNKLGLRQIRNFIGMQRSVLQRRFGNDCIQKISYALGHEEEIRIPIHPQEPYQERLPCPEPILTLTGIEIALQKLSEQLCGRLRKEGRGLRSATFKGYRMDGKTVSLTIGTSSASHNETHLRQLFSTKFESFEPGPGIELFTIDAHKVEETITQQVQLWGSNAADTSLAELLDRLTNRFGEGHVHRFLPDEHYWPERSVREAQLLSEKPVAAWPAGNPRPVHLLATPQRIEVTAPIPDYPPMHFRYQGRHHKIVKADGPERIEQEWWLQDGQHRDYYAVEDEEGKRYWLFRSGHYQAEKKVEWFVHGYFS